ncbi:heat shock protein [Reticulomyxa filosa]|uniref:Heat shock protein n=1 Tax=Reticulomyxa filosa TaxID=46433 RepID=X6LR16_RETFI|nr:heat shock protein [Reticulomyxa filosa]|eukprot:ETO03592.1 heat shock protein [Reticulomyxa filosa]
MDYHPNISDTYIFYNMGSTSTQKVSKASKHGKPTIAFEVLGQGWDEILGGSKFDSLIIDILMDKATALLQKKKVDASVVNTLSTNPKIMTRLKQEAQRAKRVLSANKDTVVGVEGLHGDIDFKHTITREEFLASAENLLNRVVVPIDEALTRANVQKENIEGIVLLGGGTRIPRIREILTDYLRGKSVENISHIHFTFFCQINPILQHFYFNSTYFPFEF